MACALYFVNAGKCYFCHLLFNLFFRYTDIVVFPSPHTSGQLHRIAQAIPTRLISNTDQEEIMKSVRARRLGLILFGVLIVLALAAITTGSLAPQNQLASGPNQKLTLSRPAFMQSARADVPQEIADRLDEEAGISAWIDSGFPINLANAATSFRVIEDQTSDYIIGSVDLPNYSENYDAHAFVHVNGWILAYYFRQDPTSKIIRIKEADITSTNLASIVSIVASASGVPTNIINYYDFRYPNAENILFVYEHESDGNSFTINIPSTNAYYERGFAAQGYYNNMSLDSISLAKTYAADGACYGTISAAQLPPDTTHTFAVDDQGVLVITFTEP